MRLLFDPDALRRELALSRGGSTTATLGAMYLDAVTTLSHGAQYRGYPFVDDMRGAALVALMGAAKNFRGAGDPNPYLATIIRNAFHETIRKEKRHLAKVLKLAADAGADLSDGQQRWLRDYDRR